MIVLVAAMATACATRGSVHVVQGDVAKVRGELTEVRVAQDLVSADLARVLAELRSLDARAADTQQTARDAASEVVRLRTRLEATEDELRQGRPVQGARPASPRPPGHATPSPVLPAPGVTIPSALITPPAAMPAPNEGEAPRASRDDAEQTFAAALNTFRVREHGQAVLGFLDFIAKYPKHPRAASAQYWIGEAYYVERDYPQALIEFNRVLPMAPTSPAAADALLRIGMCHAALREPAPAAAAWQRIVREHPRTDAAAKARSFLRASGIPSH